MRAAFELRAASVLPFDDDEKLAHVAYHVPICYVSTLSTFFWLRFGLDDVLSFSDMIELFSYPSF